MKMKRKGNEDEVKMTMRWKLLNQDAKRGTQKKRERANTNTWNLAQNGQPWKGKGKEKRRPTENGTRPAEEGEDRSAWTNLTRRKPTTTSARNGPNLPGERRTQEHMEKGTHGELVNDMIHPHCMQSVVIRLKGPRLSRPNPVNGLSCQPLNYVHKFQPHRENQKKETTPGKHVLIPPKMPCHVANSRAPYSLGHHWKTDVVAASGYAARKPREELKPHGGQLFNQATSTGWESKNGQQFTLLRRITISKV